MLDRDGAVLHEEADPGTGGRPEVLRGDLRQLLLDSLPGGTVRWGSRLSRVTPAGEGAYDLEFADGVPRVAGMLVGADGAWSRVRPVLSEAKPEYVGTTFVETYLDGVDERHPAAAELVGRGAMYAFAPSRGIVAHLEAGGVIHVYAQLDCSADWPGDTDFGDTRVTISRTVAEFEGWAPALVSLITESDAALVRRRIYALPDEHRWRRVPGVTLIGDAAYPSPPSGEGANLAMLDGAELGQAIVDHPGDFEAALTLYEATMFRRGVGEAAGARRLLRICLGDNAPFGLIDFLTGRPSG